MKHVQERRANFPNPSGLWPIQVDHSRPSHYLEWCGHRSPTFKFKVEQELSKFAFLIR